MKEDKIKELQSLDEQIDKIHDTMNNCLTRGFEQIEDLHKRKDEVLNQLKELV
jgi:hypothetical protein